jgi:hypothetical protein
MISVNQCLPPTRSAVRLLREELMLLHEAGSYVGEVVKAMGKTKVLVKVTAFSILCDLCLYTLS